VVFFQEFIDTPVNGRPSLFRIDSVHQMELLFPSLYWSINTKFMVRLVKEISSMDFPQHGEVLVFLKVRLYINYLYFYIHKLLYK
jgi:hypothetical protein